MSNFKFSDRPRGISGQRIPRRRPYRLQMRNRNNGRNSHLGFRNEKVTKSSRNGYINHKIGVVENFGDIGLVASESVRDYATASRIRGTRLKKVRQPIVWILSEIGV